MDYLESQELVVKRVMKSGNAGSVYVPRDWVSRRVVIRPISIKENILQMVAPFLENIVGIFLYGSYARGEESPESDVDLLVVTNRDIPLGNYVGLDIEVVRVDEIRDRIRGDPVGYYSMIKEAVPIMNEFLLTELKKIGFDSGGVREYYEGTESALSIVKGLLELEGDLTGSIYSLILRLRGMYLIKCNLRNMVYSNKDLEDFIVERGIDRKIYRRMYAVYRAVRDGRTVPSYIIPPDNVKALHAVAVMLLAEGYGEKKEKSGKGH